MRPFTPIRKQRASTQVVESIRAAVLNGHLRPGSSLDSERELATQFAVNRSTVREAMMALVELGLIELRHGGATRVRDFRVDGSPVLIEWLVFRGRRVDERALADLLELRVGLLGFIGQRAAHRASAEDLEALAALAKQLEQPGQSAAAVQGLDFDFVEALVAATKNDVARVFMGPIRRIYRSRESFFRPLFTAPHFDPAVYARMLEALRSGDPEASAAAAIGYAETAYCLVGEAQRRTR